MTAHELAKKLLEGPDLPVCYEGWSAGEYYDQQVGEIEDSSGAFVNNEYKELAGDHIKLT